MFLERPIHSWCSHHMSEKYRRNTYISSSFWHLQRSAAWSAHQPAGNFGCYPLDVITMSEIWLKNNNLLLYTLLCYLLLTYYPGYIHAFNSRNNTRIGGVGIYIKESIKFNRHTDLEKQYPNLEHLWVEIPGHNRHRVLLEIIYCSDLILPYNNWLNSLSHCLVT